MYIKLKVVVYQIACYCVECFDTAFYKLLNAINDIYKKTCCHKVLPPPPPPYFL